MNSVAQVIADQHRRRRLVCLAGLTLASMGVGMIADFVVVPSLPLWKAAAAVLLSPIAITVGGAATTIKGAHSWLFIGGLFFWPIYLWLAARWIRRGEAWLPPLLFIWSLQGSFQLIHRLEMILSA